MRVEEYTCNLCGEELKNTDEFIGMNLGSNSEFCPSNIETAKYHICGCCIVAMGAFAEKWRDKDNMSPAAKYAWGLCW